MCGIAGFLKLSARGVAPDILESTGRRMADRIAVRGPDSSGIWTDSDVGVTLAHRRLSILDLSANGHQPMHSADGRYVMVYNGETYNFPALRSELAAKGHAFQGGSDTEVILAACVEWGPQAAFRRLNGMFAVALWDRQDRTLTLARDRVGIKPLYWARQGDLFLFGSQPKAITAHPGFTAQVDRNGLAEYLRFSYVPAPLSIFKDMYKLRPAHMLTIGPDGRTHEVCYWDLTAIARDTPRDGMGTDAAAVEELDLLLRDSVASQMISDVPIGAFLSGGIDSSTVVALMQAQSSKPVKTFTIGFGEEVFNEAAHAAAIATHLGTEHHELTVTARDALDVVPNLADIYDEPFADSSQIPTYLVSKLTRQHVTVALSGDGGDELFGGYNRYLHAPRLLRRAGSIPAPARRLVSALLRSIGPQTWNAVGAAVPGFRTGGALGDQVHKLAGVLGFADRAGLYADLTQFWRDPEQIMPAHADTAVRADRHWAEGVLQDTVELMQLCDMQTYMIEDVLAKVDRASMAVSLESRVPLLDHRLLELSWRLKPDQKIRGGQGKWLLRQVLYRYVPAPLIDRPKQGFAIPLAEWLRGPLRPWAEDLLSPSALSDTGLFTSDIIGRRWAQHVTGARNWAPHLWNILMAQAWARAYRPAA